MKHSDLQKDHHANHGVVCSGNNLCRDCRIERKKINRPITKLFERLIRGFVRRKIK